MEIIQIGKIIKNETEKSYIFYIEILIVFMKPVCRLFSSVKITIFYLIHDRLKNNLAPICFLFSTKVKYNICKLFFYKIELNQNINKVMVNLCIHL